MFYTLLHAAFAFAGVADFIGRGYFYLQCSSFRGTDGMRVRLTAREPGLNLPVAFVADHYNALHPYFHK